MGGFEKLNKIEVIKKEIINLLDFDIFLDKRKDFKLTEIQSWDSLKYINLLLIFEKFLKKKLKAKEIEKLLSKKGILSLLSNK
jgi:hypothetical protein